MDSRTTQMSEEDKRQVGGGDWENRYFQSSNAFDINEALRVVARDGGDERAELEKRLRRIKSDADVQETLKTIDAMDRNMKPLNKNIRVVRLADNEYLHAVLNACGVNTNGIWGKLRDADTLANIKSKIVGAKIFEHGYMSTTYNLSLDDSAFRGRPVKLDMDVSKGTKAMFSPTNDESEMVLARKSGYTIKDVYTDKDGYLVLSVKV